MAEEEPHPTPRQNAGEAATDPRAAAAPAGQTSCSPTGDVGAVEAAAHATPAATADPPATPAPKRNDIAQLLDFAGGRKPLTYVGLALSAVSQLLGFVPYVCIWLVARRSHRSRAGLAGCTRNRRVRLVGYRRRRSLRSRPTSSRSCARIWRRSARHRTCASKPPSTSCACRSAISTPTPPESCAA